MSYEVFATRLVEERERIGLKAVDVYKQLDMHQNTYRNYETGKRDMPISILAQLWDLGFDVMYVVTGVYSDTAMKLGIEQRRRLIYLPEMMDLDTPSDQLLKCMYHAEETLIQAGAKSGEDYEYKDLADLGMGLMDRVFSIGVTDK